MAASDQTREPTLRELSMQLAGLRELVNERDARYTERAAASSAAIDAALKAQERLANSVNEASQKAIDKADINAEKWRANANEWRGAMTDREGEFARKPEVDAMFSSIRLEIQSLRESRAEGVGGRHNRDDSRANIALIISLVGVVVVLISHFWK